MSKNTEPNDYWTGCAKCKDVHKASEKIVKKSRWGFYVHLCPKCQHWGNMPSGTVPKQRELFGGADA